MTASKTLRELVVEAKVQTVILRIVEHLQVSRQLEVLQKSLSGNPASVLATIDRWANRKGASRGSLVELDKVLRRKRPEILERLDELLRERR